eukprot:1161260-Pelagomonas_calceolata.AAC.5
MTNNDKRMFLKLEDLAEQGEQRVSYSPPLRKSGWPSFLPWARNSHEPALSAVRGSQQQQQQQQKWGQWGKQLDDSSSGGLLGDDGGSKSSSYTCFFMTDVDQRTYLAQGPQERFLWCTGMYLHSLLAYMLEVDVL